MPTIGHILRVMIASPGDILTHRDAVESAIHEWNLVNAVARQMILLPWRWETSAVPLMGGHPQTLLNAQGIDQSDLVIALFGGRLGSPTPNAVSGTVEEIERAVQADKPVHLYFSTEALPSDVDVDQLVALRDFKQQVQSRALYVEYSSPAELRRRVMAALTVDSRDLYLPALPHKPRKEPARFRAWFSWSPGMRPLPHLTILNIGGHTAKAVRVDTRRSDWGISRSRANNQIEIGPTNEYTWYFDREPDIDSSSSQEVTIEIIWFDDWSDREMSQILDIKMAERPDPRPYPNYAAADDSEQ